MTANTATNDSKLSDTALIILGAAAQRKDRLLLPVPSSIGASPILLVDEADALAQSREATQMHHEDRAGVNAFIRGIDRIANAKLPAAVLMCTNRLGALDPAVRRRAADILDFSRPDEKQRRSVLSSRLEPLGLSDRHIDALVTATGPKRGAHEYGFTFSDPTQRLLPTIVLDAYPSKPVDGAPRSRDRGAMVPTPPFRDGEKSA